MHVFYPLFVNLYSIPIHLFDLTCLYTFKKFWVPVIKAPPTLQAMIATHLATTLPPGLQKCILHTGTHISGLTKALASQSAYCAIQNGVLQLVSDREITGMKLLSNQASSKNFTAIHGCFVLYTTHVKVLTGWKRRKKRKMTKVDFQRFQVCHFNKAFGHS